tara:strand:- start:2490 stop:3416 length:927 start_codon:yes stop_codon:yes gene_type:complete
MTYFKYLPTLNYTFPDGTTKSLVNIYKRGFVKQNSDIYDKILVKGGQTPERLANNLYENPHLFWQILYANKVISRNDWALTDIEIDELFENYYKGFSFHIFATPELTLRRGDIITVASEGIPIDPDNWAIVDTYDSNIRKISSLYFTENFFSSLEGTEIFIWRLVNENVDGDFSDRTFQIFSSSNEDLTFVAKKITRIQSSISQFKNTSTKQIISPFRETSGTTLLDELTIDFDSSSTSLIAKYIKGFDLPSELSIFSVRDFLTKIETDKRGIFVPKKTITGNITDAFRIIMSSTNALSSYGSVTSTT